MRTLEIETTHPWPGRLPDVLQVPPVSHPSNVKEIMRKFGGADQLRNAANQLQSLLYAT